MFTRIRMYSILSFFWGWGRKEEELPQTTWPPKYPMGRGKTFIPSKKPCLETAHFPEGELSYSSNRTAKDLGKGPPKPPQLRLAFCGGKE